ncbi:MAG: TonB-dependent receptor [Bacteroidia bacterium]
MKTLKRILTASAALIISLQLSHAQYTVKGVVKDNDNNHPIPGAVVSIPNTTTATSTDTGGMFTLQSQTNFDSIKISSVGYADKIMTVGDKSQSITVMLMVSSNPLNEVEVLGVKKAQSVTTLTMEDLNRQSGLNLQDALNDVPGVNMQSRSPWGGQNIIIRGYYPGGDAGHNDPTENFNGYGYQLFIDGVPVTDGMGVTVMDDIDFSNLGQVQITKGPDPVYGSFIAGAVLLSTPTPTPNQTSFSEGIMGGSYGLFRDNTTIQTSNGTSDLWVNYGRQVYNGFRPNDGSSKNYLSFAYGFHPSDKNSISAYFGYANSLEGLAGEIDSAEFYKRTPNESDTNYDDNSSHVAIESFRGGVTDNYKLCKNFEEATTVYLSGFNLSQYFAHGYSLENELSYGGRTAFTFKTENDKLGVDGILGAAFQKSDENSQGNFYVPLPFILAPGALNPGPFTDSSKAASSSNAQSYGMNYNIFTQWRFKLVPQQLTLTLGGSLNFEESGYQNLMSLGKNASTPLYLNNPWYIRAYTPDFTPSASLIKVFNGNVSAYVTVAAGYTPPPVGDLANSAYGGIDAANLKPESDMMYEVGTKGTLANGKFAYQLAIYDMDITNRIVGEDLESVAYYTNAGEQTNMGAELYMGDNVINDKTSTLSLVRPWISYTYSDDKFKTFTDTLNTGFHGNNYAVSYNGNYVPAVAQNVFNIGVDLGTKMGLYFNVTFRYVGKEYVTFDNSHYMSPYNLLSAKLGYRNQFGKHFALDAYVGGDNLLSSTYYSQIFVGQNINELAQFDDPISVGSNGKPNGNGDGYILPAPFDAVFYGGVTFKYIF